jgi:hypothetical protein
LSDMFPIRNGLKQGDALSPSTGFDGDRIFLRNSITYLTTCAVSFSEARN